MKNEFIKIFKKKSTYIILIITLAFIIFSNFMYRNSAKQMYSGNYSDEDIQYYEEAMPSSSKDPETNDMYISMKSNLDMMKLVQKYGYDSWQAYVIQTYLESEGYLYVMNEHDYAINPTVSEKEYLAAKEHYESFVQKLDVGDWKHFARTELERVEQDIKTTSDEQKLAELQTQKQVLQWRLDKDISYAESFLNTCLRRYESHSNTVYEYEHSNNHEYSEKQEYYNSLETLNTCKYYIENNTKNIDNNDNRSILLDLLNNYELFILIFVIMIAGSIVSDEFSKGTIKLLLVRPYSRTKILLAKFMVCIIILILFIAFVAAGQYLIGGLIQGFDSTSVPAVIYNHNTHQIETMSIIRYIAITGASKAPMYLLLMTLAFACSTLFTNTAVSIVIPLLGYMGSSLINQLALVFNIKALLYFVTPNWDFTQYLFGGLPEFETLTIPFSIAICLVYFAIMVVTMFTVFKKRNIKNI